MPKALHLPLECVDLHCTCLHIRFAWLKSFYRFALAPV